MSGKGPAWRSDGAWQVFRDRVAELGGTVIEPSWLGANTRHRVRCRYGHSCMTLPASTRCGVGICRTCARKDPKTAEAAFRARVADLGAEVLEGVWRGTDKPHQVRCAAGHIVAPRPSDLSRGQGLCRVCAYEGFSVAAERAFRSRVAELGGLVLEPEWLGNQVHHRARCAAGHDVKVRPASVQQGNGICRRCRGRVWDVFYVVADDEENRIKFGITSGNAGPRLRTHARDGFRRIVRLLTALPGDTAPQLERAVIATLRLAGEKPVRGVEYYDAATTATVLDVVDGYPIPPSSGGLPKECP